ncbi:MAG: PDZ domain-containing protein [bacterium]|nr:PDZ domain-containing protein [bacterium]
MRRMVYISFALFLSISISACKDKPERYSIGIGVTLDEIGENIEAFGVRRGGQDLWFNNKSGKFNGAISLRQVLENGPAEKVGLEAGDTLLEIDGEDASELGVSGVVEKITNKSVGDSVDLKVRKTDENGNILKEFNTNVTLEKIDRVAWIPLNLELGGSFCTGDECIKYTTKVSEDKAKGKFTYYFSFSSTHSKPVIVQSPLFNLLRGRKKSDIANSFLKLDPILGEDFVVESDDFPVSGVPAPIREFMGADDDPDMLKYFQENYPDINSLGHYYKDQEGKLWLNTSGTSGYFFVPAGWRPVLVEENERFWKR